MAWQLYRTVVESASVTSALQQQGQQHPRLDEAWAALTWLLSRRADSLGATKMVGDRRYHLYRQDGDPVAGTPDILVLYWTDESQVYVEGTKVGAAASFNASSGP